MAGLVITGAMRLTTGAEDTLDGKLCFTAEGFTAGRFPKFVAADGGGGEFFTTTFPALGFSFG